MNQLQLFDTTLQPTGPYETRVRIARKHDPETSKEAARRITETGTRRDRQMLFKILGPNGKAIHGGTGSWPLPKDGEPGEWMEVEGEPSCCRSGLHLVSDPLRWWQPKARLFVAEPDLTRPMSSDNFEKAAFQRARLVEEITPDWPLLCCFPRIRAFIAAAKRSRNPDANLADANLAGAYLAGADLAGADLARANLARAYLAGANLARADLVGADLVRAYRPFDPPNGWHANDSGHLVCDEQTPAAHDAR